jgi:hypothetical protein
MIALMRPTAATTSLIGVGRRALAMLAAATFVAWYGCAPVVAQPAQPPTTPPVTGPGRLPIVRIGTKPVNVLVEKRTNYPGSLPSPLYIPLTATLVDPSTGQPVPEEYAVAAIATSPTQPARDQFEFAYPYGAAAGALPGVYHGVVIVPASGHYTIVVNAFNKNDANTSKIPTSLGSGQLSLDVEGPPLASASTVKATRRADVWEPMLLGFHSVVGMSWFVLAGFFALLALPSRRRILSSGLIDFFDRNFARFAQALLWLTVLVWVTGFVNLKKAVAYPPPLSASQAKTLFRLPYAEPYTIALYCKIAMFIVVTVAAVALVREARRRALEVEPARRTTGASGRLATLESTGPGARQPAVPRTAKEPAPASTTDTLDRLSDAEWPSPGRTDARLPRWMSLSARVAVAILVVGASVILLCVTILKYAHILSEQLRSIK